MYLLRQQNTVLPAKTYSTVRKGFAFEKPSLTWINSPEN